MANQPRILFCHCNYAQVVPGEVKQGVLEGLCQSGRAFEAVADLCEMSARRDPALKRLAAGVEPVKIAACYPRAVKWLFGSCQAELDGSRTEVVNMRELSAEDATTAVLNESVTPNLPADGSVAETEGDKKDLTMAIADETTLRIVLYEGEGAASLEAPDRTATVAALLEQGYAVTCAGEGVVAPADDSSLLVLGRFADGKAPEAEDAAGNVSLAFRDITGLDPEGITALVETERESTQSAKHGEWKPWFPVIDFDRCTNCMQCLSFCLFDVYGTDDDQQIQVQNNDNCKTNCPACSRVCPEAAIMFPKYKSGPINGDVVSDGDLNREKMKIDISALLGGDVYQMLRDRSQRARSRFSKERSSDKALGERTKCLTKLAAEADIDIPLEVLQSLPSADEIAKKAEAAKAKAKAALDSQSS